MTLVRFYPRRNSMNRIHRDLDEVFNSLFGNSHPLKTRNGFGDTWQPRVDATENTDGFVLTVELPGMSKEDISIQFEDGLLKIEGERKRGEAKDGENYLREERRYGKFSRAFNINTRIQENKIEAKFNNGLLSILLPKAEEAKPKEINIKV